VPEYFKYCTRFSNDEFNQLCSFFRIPSTAIDTQTLSPVTYRTVEQQINLMPLRQQFLLVALKLRPNFELKKSWPSNVNFQNELLVLYSIHGLISCMVD